MSDGASPTRDRLHLPLAQQQRPGELVRWTVAEVCVYEDRIYMVPGERIEHGPVLLASVVCDKYGVPLRTPRAKGVVIAVLRRGVRVSNRPRIEPEQSERGGDGVR